jgi:DNA-binding winged helix-turn-helix (wHTH) protein/TolB-like protein/Tfp pilus assembly protein PilF
MPAGEKLFQFGPFCVDARRRTLERDGQPVAISGKALDILLVLLRIPGAVVEKDELMREVWPDTVVEENNLTVNISGLRKALGDTVANPKLIITVPGRGYRFAGDLTAPPPAAPAARKPPRALWIAAAAVLACVLAAAAWLARPKPPHTLAVLPFRVLNADADHEYLGVGLADAVITRLGNLRQITVRPLTSVLRLAGRDPFEAGQAVNADTVLDGNIQVAADHVRVSLQWLRVKDRASLWAESFDEDKSNLFTLEDSIAARLESSIAGQLSGTRQGAPANRQTRNPQAYGDYLRARYYATRYTEEGFRKALAYLQSAIDTDPGYGLAYSGLADAYYAASNMLLPPSDAMPRAREAALRAAKLDPSLAEAHVSLGLVASKYNWDWAEAEREFRAALALDPNSAGAHLWYGLYRAQLGDLSRAVAEVRRAQELDPLSNDANSYLATTLYWARRYDDALRQGRKVIQFDPEFVPGYVGAAWILEAQGRPADAVGMCEKARALESSPWTALALARSRALAGRREPAEKAVRELASGGTAEFVSGYDMAVVWAALGKTDEAFGALEQAYRSKAEWLVYLKVDPQVDALRSDPRFAALLRRLGLDGNAIQ